MPLLPGYSAVACRHYSLVPCCCEVEGNSFQLDHHSNSSLPLQLIEFCHSCCTEAARRAPPSKFSPRARSCNSNYNCAKVSLTTAGSVGASADCFASMRPGKQSTEPRHLVGVRKTCPRTDCPNPNRGVKWRGSPKQVQYHCLGCWRKFDYGGIARSWAKQVTPQACWLRELPEHERAKPQLPKLPKPPRRSVSAVPAPPQQVHGLARGRAEQSLARSSRMTGTAQGLHAVANPNLASGPAELGLEQTLRADEVQREESGACATQGQGRDAGTASTGTDLVGNSVGEDIGHDPASPTWHDLIDLSPLEPHGQLGVGGGTSDLLPETMDEFEIGGGNDFIPEPLGEFGVDGTALPMWSFDTPNHENSFWEGAASSFGIEFPAVPERPGTIIIIPVSDDSKDVQSSDCSITAASANPAAEHSVRPERKAVKISFLRYAVPSVTCMYSI